MHIGESVGFALAIAKENEVHFIDLDIDKLQRKLAQERILLTYFDDVELIQPDTYVPALQYLGTKGFFPTYKATPEDSLTSDTAEIWLESILNTRRGKFIDANEVATSLAAAETTGEKTILNWKAFIDTATKMDADYGSTIQKWVDAQFFNQTLTRAKACEVLYLLLGD
jgi:hypothetical protein